MKVYVGSILVFAIATIVIATAVSASDKPLVLVGAGLLGGGAVLFRDALHQARFWAEVHRSVYRK